MRSGSTETLSPMVTNQKDINCTWLPRLTVPLVNGVSAYDYEVSSGWSLIESDESAGVFMGMDQRLNCTR